MTIIMLEYLQCLLEYRVLFLSLIGIYLLYILGKLNHNLHKKLGHKGPPPLPYIGNMIDLFHKGPHLLDQMCYKKYGKIYPFYFGNIKVSMVADEDLLKQILIKEAKCFTDRLDLGFNSKVTQKMLTVLKGKDWERVRNLITPTFTSGKLRKMSPLISDGIELLQKRISDHPTTEPIDLKEFFGALTMDVIARSMFGMHIDSQTNPKNMFVINAKKLFSVSLFNPFILLFLIFPATAKYIRKFVPKWSIMGTAVLEFFTNNLEKAIKERQKSTDHYNDFLALMLRAHTETNDSDPSQSRELDSKSLTIEEIMAQSLIFLLAGYETTATTLTFIAYFLAKNPSVQLQLYSEIIDSIGSEGVIKYEVLMNMPYLDSVVCETLRMCPPASRIDRTCTQDVTLVTSDNETIIARKGDVFSVPIYAIHTDPSIWPDPDVFDPERFSLENKKLNSPYSFMPFGMGPRNCVGMRFALLETKWAIVSLLQKFELVTCPETLEKIQFKKSGLSSPIKPILLKVVKRETS